MKTKTVRITCDECGDVFSVTVDENTKQYLKDILNQAGWFENEEGNWVCPNCC